MSEQPVKKSDLIEGNPIDEFSKELDRGIEKLTLWDNMLRKISKTMDTILKRSNSETLADVDKLSKALDNEIERLKLVDQNLKKVAKTMQNDLKTAMSDTLKGIEAINNAEKRSKTILTEKKNTEQSLRKIQEQEVKLRNARIKAFDDFEKKLKREEKAQKKSAETAKKSAEKKRFEEIKLQKAREKAFDDFEAGLRKSEAAEKKATETSRKLKRTNLDSANAYKRLTKRVNTAQVRFKRLAVQYGETDKRTIRSRKNFQRLDDQLRRVNNQARDGRRDVGRYGLATEKMGNSVRKVTGLLAQFGLAIGGAAIVRGAIKTLVEFDEKLADIQKTTGLTAKGAREVSLAMLEIDTKTPVSELQELLSAGGRLGIEGTKNLIGFATAADRVFVALGDDLEGSAEEIATQLGKISSLFDLDVEFGIEGGITRVGSIINELSATSKAAAGPLLDFISRVAGFSDVLGIEEVAAFGTLFDEAGVSMEVAASTMNKVLPNMIDNIEELAEVTGKTEEEFREMLKSNPAQALIEVARAAKGTEGGLEELVKNQKLFGQVGTRALPVLNALTNGTEDYATFLATATEQLEKNNSIQDEFNIKNETFAATIAKLTKEFEKYIIGVDGGAGVTSKLKSAIGFLTKNLTTILSILGKVIKTFIVFKGVMLALKLKDRVKEFKAAGGSIKNLGKNMEGASESAKGFGQSLKKIGFAIAIAAALELAQVFFDIATGAVELRAQMQFIAQANESASASIEKTSNEQQERIKGRFAVIERLRARGRINDEEEIERKKSVLQAEISSNNSIIISLRERYNFEISEIERVKKVDNDFTETSVKAHKAFARTTRLEIEGLRALQIPLNDELNNFNNQIAAANEGLSNKEGLRTVKAINKEISEVNKQLLLTTKRTEAQPLQSRIKQLQLEREAILGSKKKKDANKDEKKSVKDLTDEILRQGEVEKTRIEEREAFDVEQLQKDSEDILKAEENRVRRTGRINADLFNARLNQEERLRKAIIERQFIESLDAATSAEDVELALQRRSQDIQRVEDDILQRRIQGIDTLNTAQEEFASKRRDRDKKEDDELKERLKLINQIEQAITNALEEQIDKRIALKQEEKDAAKEAQDFFMQLAAEGNLEAKDSIKEQIAFQKEAQREIARLERQKANIQLFSLGLQTFQNELAGGASSGEALTTTILSTTVLTGFLSGLLNFFEKGTMNAPEGMAVVDEKGAEMITDRKGNIKSLGTGSGARLTHLTSGDKVFTAAQTASKMAALDNVDNAQQMSSKKDSAGNSFDLMAIQKGIGKAFDSSIKKMPHTTTKWGQITQGMGKVIEEKVRGNDTERTNHYTS